MSNSHVESLTLALFIYVFLGISHFGWGKTCAHILGIDEREQEKFPITFSIWIGWAVSLFLFQIIHFVLPLNAYTTTPVLIFGTGFSSLLFTSKRKRRCIQPLIGNYIRSLTRKPAVLVAILAAILIISVWVTARAMLPPTNGDSGLYHLHTIRWVNSFHIILGLGNLHGRLAFNQAYLVYVAALNFYPFFGHGRSVANSFLFILTAMTLVELLLPAIQKKTFLTKVEPLQWGSTLFSIPVLAYLALSSDGLASPSSDLTSSLLQLVIFVIFAHALSGYLRGNRESLHTILVLSVLTATAITIKLSNLVFSAVIVALVLTGTWKSPKSHIRKAALILLSTMSIVIVWCVRGFLLSGAPLYPSTIGYFPVEWAVPIDDVVNEANLIYGWARQPTLHWSEVLGSWSWFKPWVLRVSTILTGVVFPFAAFLMMFIVNVATVVFLRWKRARQSYLQWLILVPLISALAFWFFTAPDPRFATVPILLMPVAMIILFLFLLRNRINAKAFKVITLAMFLVGDIHFLGYAAKNRSNIQNISTNGWHDVKKVPLDTKVTASGLHVFTPIAGDQCWDAPLPCTPYFNEDLSLRNPNDISSGFRVRKNRSSQENSQ